MKTSELPAIGAALAGGFFAGRFQIAGTHFALVVSPAASEIVGAWGEFGTKIAGRLDFIDGRQNTVELAEAGSDLARAIMQLDINGFSDWFLPARDQLELLYRNFKPTDTKNYCGYLDGYNANSVPPGSMYEQNPPIKTAAADFQADGPQALQPKWYWSSTQYSAYYAFYQDFDGGTQYLYDKGLKLRARAVRQIQLVIE